MKELKERLTDFIYVICEVKVPEVELFLLFLHQVVWVPSLISMLFQGICGQLVDYFRLVATSNVQTEVVWYHHVMLLDLWDL